MSQPSENYCLPAPDAPPGRESFNWESPAVSAFLSWLSRCSRSLPISLSKARCLSCRLRWFTRSAAQRRLPPPPPPPAPVEEVPAPAPVGPPFPSADPLQRALDRIDHAVEGSTDGDVAGLTTRYQKLGTELERAAVEFSSGATAAGESPPARFMVTVRATIVNKVPT